MENPFLKHPEVKKREKALAPALEAENLYYGYKVKQEEMLSIFDEVGEYFTYEGLAQSKQFKDCPEDFREKAGKILFKDFVALFNSDPKLVNRLLIGLVKDAEMKKIREGSAAAVSDKELEQEANLRTFGKAASLAYLLNSKFRTRQKELAEYSGEDMEKIEGYAKVNIGPVRKALGDIRTMQKGISAAKAAKSVAAVRKKRETAAVYGMEEAEVEALNRDLEAGFEEVLGLKVDLGIEDVYEEHGNVVEKDFSSAYVNYSREMRSLYRLLNNGNS